jgi:NAD(P)-dependent dehydrogenase (short-subunit alcohol dehydrogenase family)
VLQDFGTPEIVIHALGASLKAPFESPVEKWNQVMRLNFLAAVQIDNYFLPRMITCNNGRLVYIGSMASVTLDGLEPYVVAKTALDAYVKILGRRLAGSGVCASAIRPGPINVPDRYLTNLELNDPESWLAWAAEHRIREKKLLRMEEIGRLAEMLCSQDLSYINGSIFDLFGGSY